MNATTNYQLNQWAKSDQVRMEDFNADNAKIDAALGELKAGQLRLVTGNYQGNGKFGAGDPNTLTFPFPPTIVGIAANNKGLSSAGVLFIRGQTESGGFGGCSSSGGAMTISLSWSGNSVTWSSQYRATDQLNVNNTTYFYFALG